VGLPLGYAAVGLAAIAAPGYEVFPFFCWFLFPVTPNHVERYGLQLQEHAGKQLGIPIAYESLRALGARRNSMDLQMAVQALGHAVTEGDLARVDELRRRIEGNFLDAPCSYGVVLASYEPMERWRGVESTPRPLRDFVCGEFE
jgi:hypothetical protein